MSVNQFVSGTTTIVENSIFGVDIHDCHNQVRCIISCYHDSSVQQWIMLVLDFFPVLLSPKMNAGS